VPSDLIDAAYMDGAGELRIWWSILLPIIRPTLATAAFLPLSTMERFFMALLMLHNRDHMTFAGWACGAARRVLLLIRAAWLRVWS